jgi:hypothetical protein
MREYSFEVKVWATVYVKAEDETAAKRLLEENLPEMREGSAHVAADGSKVDWSPACTIEGEFYLQGIDGEDAEEVKEQERKDNGQFGVGA